MPSKKKKFNARFPPARIKKIMQTDEDVGKVAAAVPVIISRALELFIESLILKASETTRSRNAKTLSTAHIKHIIQSDQRFDFLKDLVANIPDIQQGEEDGEGLTSPPDPRPEGSKPRGRPRKKKADGEDSSQSVAKRPRKNARKKRCDPNEDEDEDEETDSATEEDMDASDREHEDDSEDESDEDGDEIRVPWKDVNNPDVQLSTAGPSCSIPALPGIPAEAIEGSSGMGSDSTRSQDPIKTEPSNSKCDPENTTPSGQSAVISGESKSVQSNTALLDTCKSDVQSDTPWDLSTGKSRDLPGPPPRDLTGMPGFYPGVAYMPPFPNSHGSAGSTSIEKSQKPKKRQGKKKDKSENDSQRTSGSRGSTVPHPTDQSKLGIPPNVPMTTDFFPPPTMAAPPFFTHDPRTAFQPAMMGYPPLPVTMMGHPGLGLPFPHPLAPRMMDPRMMMQDIKAMPPMTSDTRNNNPDGVHGNTKPPYSADKQPMPSVTKTTPLPTTGRPEDNSNT